MQRGGDSPFPNMLCQSLSRQPKGSLKGGEIPLPDSGPDEPSSRTLILAVGGGQGGMFFRSEQGGPEQSSPLHSRDPMALQWSDAGDQAGRGQIVKLEVLTRVEPLGEARSHQEESAPPLSRLEFDNPVGWASEKA